MGSTIGLFRVIGVLPDGYSEIDYGMFYLEGDYIYSCVD